MGYTPVYDTLAAAWQILAPGYLQPSSSSPMLSWQPGRTPLSNGWTALAVIITYLTVVLGGQSLMRQHKVPPQPLKGPFVVHNIALSVGSGLLLACMLEEIVPIWYQYGFFYAICNEGAWTPRMETLYIFNYMFKYLEFIDTFFLVLKKKPLQFLHVYHHAATAGLCWSQLAGSTSVSWVVITLNLFVHVVMYAYYAMSSLRIPCPWKKAVTSLQITQFLIDLGVVYFAAYTHVVALYEWNLPVKGHCVAKEEHAVWSGLVSLTSYLFLFILFYKKTYNNKKNAVVATANSVVGSPMRLSPLEEKDEAEALQASGRAKGGKTLKVPSEKR